VSWLIIAVNIEKFLSEFFVVSPIGYTVALEMFVNIKFRILSINVFFPYGRAHVSQHGAYRGAR
jgi:hypothetical protein